jgi:hypothetical protein
MYASLSDPAKQARRLDASVSFQWGLGSPAVGIPAEYFAVVWTGKLVARFSEVIRVVCACVRACVCMRACVRACACVSVCVRAHARSSVRRRVANRHVLVLPPPPPPPC